MNYVILITHGKFAEGLHDTLKMFVGEREDVLSIGLRAGEDVPAVSMNAVKALMKMISLLY